MLTSLSDYAAMTRTLLNKEAPKATVIAETSEYLTTLSPDFDSATADDFDALELLAEDADFKAAVARIVAYAIDSEGKKDSYVQDSALPTNADKCREIAGRWSELSDVLRAVAA